MAERRDERVQGAHRVVAREHFVRRGVNVDALDVALVFGLSMNQFLVGAIHQYVQTQLEQDSIQSAVAKVREARQAGLAHVLVSKEREAIG